MALSLKDKSIGTIGFSIKFRIREIFEFEIRKNSPFTC